MDANENQFEVAKPKKKTHIANTTSMITMRTGDSKVNLGRDSSLMHQTGSHPISYTGPWRMSGAGKASEIGTLLKHVGHAKEQGFND